MNTLQIEDTENVVFIIGLGNPGKSYIGSRHNIGFAVVDQIAANRGFCFQPQQDGLYCHAGGQIEGRPATLVKPCTFMNLSGVVVEKLVRDHAPEPEDIIVVQDDLDMDFGRIKIVYNRGAGGHNGIASIIDHMGTKKFVRVKVGIGKPLDDMSVSDYVLSSFSHAENELLSKLVNRVAQAVECVVLKGHAQAMNLFNGLELAEMEKEYGVKKNMHI